MQWYATGIASKLSTALAIQVTSGDIGVTVGNFTPLGHLLLPKGSLGVSSTTAATTLGSVTRKWPIIDPADGVTILGYVPLYDGIS
jgi:hypothetical protein